MTEYEVEIQEGVEVSIQGASFTFKGPKGELSRQFKHPKIKLQKKDGKIVISSEEDRKKVKAMMGTWRAHMRNMMTGVTKGWQTSLKLVYAHFPVKLEQKNDKLVIKNFLGAKSERRADIADGVEVKIEGDTVRLSGSDKEKVGQTAANIERATRVKDYDRRVFQDGIWRLSKCETIE